MRRSGSGVRCAAAWAVVVASLILTLVVAEASDDLIAVRGIDVRVVAEAEAATRPEETGQAVVGDLIHVRATVENVGTDRVEQLRVDFFFTEIITGEHGKIDSQTVYALDPQEAKRPVVTVDTKGFTPGIYVFTAAFVDAEGALGDGDPSNNSYTQDADAEGVALLDEGAQVGELSLFGSFGFCQLARIVLGETEIARGGITERINLTVYNVGTVDLSSSNIEVEVYSRHSTEPGERPILLGSYVPGSSENTLSVTMIPTSPGKKGTLRIATDYSALTDRYRPTQEQMQTYKILGRKAGQGDQLLVTIVVRPRLEEDVYGVARELVLPSEDRGAIIYSEKDLWTFPVRSDCGCDEACDVRGTTVPPTLATNFLFLATSSETTHELHVVNVTNGKTQASWAFETPIVTAPAVFYDGTADIKEWHTFVGTADGQVHALLVTSEEGVMSINARTDWQGPAGLVSDLADESLAPTTHLVLSEAAASGDNGLEGVELIVGSANGLFVLDALTGTVTEFRTAGSLSLVNGDVDDATTLVVGSSPAYAGGLVWFAVEERLFALDVERGEACLYTADDDITTPLHVSESTGVGVVFFGTRLGSVYAVEAPESLGAPGADEELSCPEPPNHVRMGRRPLAGLAVGQDNDHDGDRDLEIFAVDEDLVVWSIEYKPGTGFQLSTRKDSRDVVLQPGGSAEFIPWSTTMSVALLEDANGVEAVFVAGVFQDTTESASAETRHALYALSAGLDRVKSFQTWGETVDFVFKLDEEDSLLLSPIVADNRLLVPAPGGYLYAFNIAFP